MQTETGNASREHILFVTGQLAESAVRAIVSDIAARVGFDFSIAVLPITVAALMTPKWLLRKLTIPAIVTRVIVPGYLESGLEELRHSWSVPVDSGPRDIRNLAEFFGKKRESAAVLEQFRTEIIAEINHAPTLPLPELRAAARRLVAQGADVIDLGCTPGSRWLQVGAAVSCLRDDGIRVSIDSFDPIEVAEACAAGAELVLSVNSTNRDAALEWDTEIVVVPDLPNDEKIFLETIDFLTSRSARVRLDPILEPIGCGFARSLQRYFDCRQRFPHLPMMMGIGNLTELTDVDSAGVNFLLLGICEELQIGSVLTTNVINWARTSVQECDIARRMVHYAVQHRIPPKRLDDRLVMLRDPKLNRFPDAVIEQLAQSIRDTNVRLLAQDDQLHFLVAGQHFQGTDPFALFAEVLASPLGNKFDAGHAFYLGYEMCKMWTALTLSKQYEQDEALRWGYLTRPEKHHRISRTRRSTASDAEPT